MEPLVPLYNIVVWTVDLRVNIYHETTSWGMGTLPAYGKEPAVWSTYEYSTVRWAWLFPLSTMDVDDEYVSA